MTSPLNSAGLRTSTSASDESPNARQDVVAEGAQREVGLGQVVAGLVVGRHVGRQRQVVVEPELAAAVEEAQVGVPVEQQLPVGPGGEPVVVVAVEHDRRVGSDAALREQRAEVLAAGDVAADAVGQLAGPVPAHGARDVALLVGGGVDVDLDEADGRIVEVGFRPVGRDEDVVLGVAGNGHWDWLQDCGRGDGRTRWRGSGTGTSRRGRESAGGRSSGTGPARDTRSGPRDRRRGASNGARQPPVATRSRRANSSRAWRHSAAARRAWRTIQGSTRLESSTVTVGPEGPSSMTMPEALR